MNLENIKAPIYSYEEIRKIAEDFLDEHNSSGEIPVDIELIVEKGMGINIIPIPLELPFGIDALTSVNQKEIRIDLNTCNQNENRFRFSLAHEVGHLILHKDIFKAIDYQSIQDFKNIQDKIPSDEYGWLEWHANSFAGLILVPTTNLEKQVEKSVQKLKDEEFTIRYDNYETILGYVSTAISKYFSVSHTTVKIRIDKDNLDLRDYI